MILDLFCGPGGLEVGVRLAGITDKIWGIDSSSIANVTGRHNGFHRVDRELGIGSPIESFDFRRGGMDGILAAPPCRGFSSTGQQAGMQDIPLMIYALESVGSLADLDKAMRLLVTEMKDPHSILALEGLRWVLHHDPRWTVWEQVPQARPLWEACADVLRRCGYIVTVALMRSEWFGVPQARKRAVLMAAQHRFPDPIRSHSTFYQHDPTRVDVGKPRWRSMLDEFPEWGRADIYLDANDNPKRTKPRYMNFPARTVRCSRAGNLRWVHSDGTIVATTVEESARMQGFPESFVFQGNPTQQHRQIADAVPPPMAAAIITAVFT